MLIYTIFVLMMFLLNNESIMRLFRVCSLHGQHFNDTLWSLWVCRYHAIHKEIYNWFNISFDEFGRTSSPQQTEVCQAIFKRLLENDWLSENTMQQVMNYLLLFRPKCIYLVVLLVFFCWCHSSIAICWKLKD